MFSKKEIWNQGCFEVADNGRTALASLPLLSAAINEAELNIQAPRGLVINSALTAISIALQGLIDASKPNAQSVPVSLMLLAIANSGERKSTAESVFLKPIREFQSRQARVYSEKLLVWNAKHDSWVVRRKAVLKNIEKKMSKGLSTKEDEAVLLQVDRECPVKPKEFKILYEDSTSEALFYGMYKNLSTAGLVSSEGGGVLGGRAFNDLSKQNSIWSGDAITIDRKTSESFELVGGRLTVSMMVQESAFSEYMNNKGEQSRGSGLLARFLICHPKSRQGNRFIDGATQSWECLERFNARIEHLLDRNLKKFSDKSMEKELIYFDCEASRYWINIANEIESKICPKGILDGLGDHGSKLADVICRLAALFHCFEGFAGDISITTLRAAEGVAKWYSDNFIKLFGHASKEDEEARELNEWLDTLRMAGKRLVKKNYIRQYGPGKFRRKDVLDRLLLYLSTIGVVQYCSYVGDKTIYLDICPGQRPMPLIPLYANSTNLLSI